jgi:Peptidase M60, enhancin and enhancin-like
MTHYKISGWMHSGYPMMGFTSAEADQVNTVNIRQQGTWGIIHELGHNHQWNSWTVDGTTETGCNWFSLYVNQNVS